MISRINYVHTHYEKNSIRKNDDRAVRHDEIMKVVGGEWGADSELDV